MTVQEGLNTSSFRWKALVYDFLTHLRDFLDAGSQEYQATLLKLARMHTEFGLSAPGE